MSIAPSFASRLRLCRIVLRGFLLCSFPAHAADLHVALSEAAPPASYVSHGMPVGMAKEMLDVLFGSLADLRPQYHALPWSRAQQLVEFGDMDIFVTFPSESRKRYASFTTHALYQLDFGYLIYDAKGRHAHRISSAERFQDLKDLVFVSQDAAGWEAENVPDYIRRYMINGPASLMHMTFARKAGDFFIMNTEQAVFYARQLGYEDQLGMKKVGFIPHSQVAMHIGLGKSHPNRQRLLAAIEAAMKHPNFLAKQRAIELKYKQHLAAPSRP